MECKYELHSSFLGTDNDFAIDLAEVSSEIASMVVHII
jgi:hypothetical protein